MRSRGCSVHFGKIAYRCPRDKEESGMEWSLQKEDLTAHALHKEADKHIKQMVKKNRDPKKKRVLPSLTQGNEDLDARKVRCLLTPGK